MQWTDLLNADVEGTYRATEGLMGLVDEANLDWKPETGSNWMTMGQLLMHCTNACGFCCKGLATGDWGLPDGQKMEDMPPEDMLPPADKMPSVESVAQARELLAADKQTALDIIAQAGEARLESDQIEAPWAPGHAKALGSHLMDMVGHLANHKGQLYYYLKLQGKPVNTGHYYGMSMG
jgi:hypothetical protein